MLVSYRRKILFLRLLIIFVVAVLGFGVWKYIEYKRKPKVVRRPPIVNPITKFSSEDKDVLDISDAMGKKDYAQVIVKAKAFAGHNDYSDTNKASVLISCVVAAQTSGDSASKQLCYDQAKAIITTKKDQSDRVPLLNLLEASYKGTKQTPATESKNDASQ